MFVTPSTLSACQPKCICKRDLGWRTDGGCVAVVLSPRDKLAMEGLTVY